jgi:hypothetical protein
LLTRGIDLDDHFDLIEERLVDGAKRVCTALAVAALMICGFDLISHHSLQSTTAFAHTHQYTDVAQSPAQSRSGNDEIALALPVTAVIPRDAVAMTPPPAAPVKVANRAGDSPVAELAAARHRDAVEVAMASQPVMTKATEADLAQWAQEKARQARAMAPPDQPASGTMQLASLNPADMPATAVAVPPVSQISLPAAIAVLPRVPPRRRPPPAQRAQDKTRHAAAMALPDQPAASTAAPAAKLHSNALKVASLNPGDMPAAETAKPALVSQFILPAKIAVLPPVARRPAAPAPKQLAQDTPKQHAVTSDKAKQEMAKQASVTPQPDKPVADTVQAASASAPTPAPDAGMMQLASIDPEALAVGPSAAPTLEIHISLPATISVLPPPAPGVPPPSPAQRLHLEGDARAKAERCLANAIYFEARDQPYQGQVAVAQVVINRVFSGIYPRDVCGVVYQNANRHLACQFTFACDGKRDVVNEWPEWRRAKRIAQETLDGVVYVQAVGTATHYHANYVHPNWIHEMHRLAREGEHLFYRPIAWGNGSDEPIWSRAQKAFLKLTKKR